MLLSVDDGEIIFSLDADVTRVIEGHVSCLEQILRKVQVLSQVLDHLVDERKICLHFLFIATRILTMFSFAKISSVAQIRWARKKFR